jgi:hypothetical protein
VGVAGVCTGIWGRSSIKKLLSKDLFRGVISPEEAVYGELHRLGITLIIRPPFRPWKYLYRKKC